MVFKRLFVSIVLSLVAGFSFQNAHAVSHPEALGTTAMPTPGVYLNSEGSPLIPILTNIGKSPRYKSLDIEIYTMSDPKVRLLLREALNRNVKIRIIKEPNPVGEACDVFAPDSNDTPDCKDQQKLVTEIRRAGGRFEPYNKKALCPNSAGGPSGSGCFEHGKIVLIDGLALISTGNFDDSNLCIASESPGTCNRDFTLITDESSVVGSLQDIFDADLVGTSYDLRSKIPSSLRYTLTVSPISLTPIVDFIHSAQQSIILEAQYLEDPELNAALIERAKKGIHVSITTASTCSFGTPTPNDVKKTQGFYRAFDAAGISSAMFNASNKVNGRDGYMHAKVIVVDNSRAWLGSENGSSESLTDNREYGLIFGDAEWVKKISDVATEDHKSPNSETWQESLTCKKDHAPAPHVVRRPVHRSSN